MRYGKVEFKIFSGGWTHGPPLMGQGRRGREVGRQGGREEGRKGSREGGMLSSFIPFTSCGLPLLSPLVALLSPLSS